LSWAESDGGGGQRPRWPWCWWCSAGEAMRPAFAAAGSVACSKRKRRLRDKRGTCRTFSPVPLQGRRSQDCKELRQARPWLQSSAQSSLLVPQQRSRTGAMPLLHPCPRARRPAGIDSTAAAGDRGVDEAMPLACPWPPPPLLQPGRSDSSKPRGRPRLPCAARQRRVAHPGRGQSPRAARPGVWGERAAPHVEEPIRSRNPKTAAQSGTT
jgi:hypothetical protein